jgi:hypothetical protein
MLPLADSLVLTEVDARVPADVYFPAFDKKEWERRELSENSENNLRYVHVLYERKSKCDTLKIL